MFGFGRKHEEPQPRDEHEMPLSPANETLARLNYLESEVTQRMHHGAKRHDTSIVILMDKVYEQQRKLIHEHDVIPVVDEKTGGWRLFS